MSTLIGLTDNTIYFSILELKQFDYQSVDVCEIRWTIINLSLLSKDYHKLTNLVKTLSYTKIQFRGISRLKTKQKKKITTKQLEAG